MTGYAPRAEGDWDDDPHAPGNWLPSYGGSLRAPGVSRSWNPDEYVDPDPAPDDRAVGKAEEARILTRVRAGRCTLRAEDCGWPECLKHHPRAEREAS